MDLVIQHGAPSEILIKPTRVIRFVGERGQKGDDAEFDPGILAGFMSKQEAYDRFALFEASIRLNSEQIELKVSRQEFNAFGVRLSNAETKISQTADAILLRATKEEFNALNQRVSSAEASITVSAAAINSKVSQTTYNAFTGQVNTRFSSIEQTAFGIIQTVQGLPTKQYVDDKLAGVVTGDVLVTYNTRISQLENQISLVATKETTDLLGNRLATAEASITVQAGQIQNKVNVSTYNSLQERVTTAESTITQQATLIQSKVSQSTVDSLTNRVSNSESIISQHSNQISQKVSTTDFTGQTLVSLINQTASNIKIQAKNIDLVGLTTANSLRTAAAGRRITINENNDNAIKIRYDNNTVGLEAVVTPLDEVKLVFRDKNGNIIWEAGKSGLVYINELPESWGGRFHRLITPVGSPDQFYDLDGNLMFNGETLRSMAQSTTNANGLAVRGEREQFTDGQLYEFRNYTLNTSQFVTNWEYNAGQNVNSSLNQQYNGIHVDQDKSSPFIQNGWYITNGSGYGWTPQGGYNFQYDMVAVKDGKVVGAVTGQIDNITLPNN